MTDGASPPFAALVIAVFGALTALGAIAVALLIAIDHWHRDDGLRRHALATALALAFGVGAAFTRLGSCVRLHWLQPPGCAPWVAPADSVGHLGLALAAILLLSLLLRRKARVKLQR